MIFKLDNYNVLFDTSDIFSRDNSTENIVTADLPNIKTLGVVNNESNYKIEPQQVIVDSLGEEVIGTYQLDFDLRVTSVMDATKLSLLDANLVSIVLAPKTIKIANDASDLSATENDIPTGSKVLVFKPGTIKITEEVKLGNREINPLTLKQTVIANLKSQLIKEFNITTI